MSRKKIWILVIAVVSVNFMMILLQICTHSKWSALQAEDHARERQELSEGFRMIPVFGSKHDYYNMIGALVKGSFWTKRNKLLLTKEQADAILKLDGLVWDASVKSWLADADYLDGNPPEFKEYVARSKARRYKTISHAQRMVSLGLLTEPQAAFVMQRYLSGSRHLYPISDPNVQELLGITENQKMKLAEVGKEANSREARLNLWSVDQKEQEQIRATMDANTQALDAAATGILTPSQLDIWSRLTAERSLPAEPPDLPALSNAEAARIKISDLSPTFHELAERTKTLGLSADQNKQLKGLEEVMQHGLLWTGPRSTEGAKVPAKAPKEPVDQAPNRRAEFVMHAEQVALLGILTESQAKQVQAAVSNKN
jgi:hypothetical protein